MVNSSLLLIRGHVFIIISIKKGLWLSDLATFKILGQKFIKFLRWLFGKLKTPKSHSEINWPLLLFQQIKSQTKLCNFEIGWKSCRRLKFLSQFLSGRLSYTSTLLRSLDVFGGIPLLDFTSLARSSMVTVGFINAKKPIQITPDRDLPWAQWTKGFIHKWCH